MTGEAWTAIAAAIGAIGGAAASGGVAVWVTKRQVDSAERQALLQRQHERSLAHEEREQGRLVAAYQTISAYLGTSERDIRWLTEPHKAGEPRPGPVVITPIELAFANIVVSKDVAEPLDELTQLVTKFYDELAGWGLEHAPVAGVALSNERLLGLARESLALITKVLNTMRSELGAGGYLD